MTDKRVKAQTGGMEFRWWIQAPGHDETFRSIIERAERLYGRQGDAFRLRLRPRATRLPGDDSDLDVLSAREIFSLGRIIGVDPRKLFAHRLNDDPLLLESSERRAYCPACWKEDLRAGRPLAFRRSWASLFALRCPIHEAPLHWLSPHMNLDAALDAPALPNVASSIRILHFIESFADAMGRALAGTGSWPESWRGNAYAAKALLMRCVVNLGCMNEHPPFASVSGPPDLLPFVQPPKRRLEPLRNEPWMHVRTLGSPAWRRAAFWMVSRYVIPAPKPGCLPEGLPAQAFASLDAQWDAVPPGFRGFRRTRRYGDALRAMCHPFPIGKDG